MNAFGWPFLVGRGRRTGHRVLLAPDFLVAERDHGILEATSEQVTELTTSAGRRLSVRCSTHEVSAEDVAEAENPRDEHGRPLRLIYGVVATGVEPANADLVIALESALDIYRRFLPREGRFEVVAAQAFPLSGTPRPALVAPIPSPVRRRSPTGVAVLSGAGLAAALAIALIVLWGRSEPEPSPGPPPLSCPTTTAPTIPTTATPPPGSAAPQCGTATSSSGRPLSSRP